MIETDRLLLRPLSTGDLDAWSAFMADPQARAGLHTPEPVIDPERVAQSLERFVAEAEMYVVIVRETGETSGFVGFVPRDLEWGPELELGWLLLPAHWGRGYATEAARALRPLQQRRIVSLIRTDNPASENVARKLGMTRERELEYYGFPTGVWVSPG